MSITVDSTDFAEFMFLGFKKHVTNMSTQAYNGIVDRTPVDTGQARASWNMTKNEPDYRTVDFGDDLPPPKAPVITFKFLEFPKIYIANGKPYINYLENGWSKQAPYGMVAITLAGLK